MSDVVLPQPGPEIERLLEVFRLDHGLLDLPARAQKVEEAQRILSHGPVVAKKSAIGLALGFVQSGKTMSFTTLTALAADTGYRVIVIILGNTHLLVDQNTDRLLGDLRIEERDDWRWAHLHLPHKQDIDFYLSQDDRVVLITVLKNATRLSNVAKLFEASNEVSSLPALIIDDEADQASLNAGVKKAKQTPTYKAIQRMRSALGPHLYVQYTATPFAPLLLEPSDELSPEFLEVLAPGEGYTGGTAFFIEKRNEVVRAVTPGEAEEKNPGRLPPALDRAVSSFLVGSALLRATGAFPNIASMLIHTSGMKVDHKAIWQLVESNLQPLRVKARLPADDPGKAAWLRRLESVRDDFTTHGTPPVSDEDFAREISWCAQHAKVWMVNSSEEAEALDWKMSPVNILIGGNKLDRGFTVKGLTTTYMTRRAQGGQADTIEQRARCYGYKRSYIDQCRFFGPTDVVDAFTSLVHTEADMRESLIAWVSSGRQLRDWSAENGLLLPDDMRPTRPTVLKETYSRGITGWSFLRRPDTERSSTDWNRGLVGATGLLDEEPDVFGDVRVRTQENVALEVVLEDLLKPWRVTASAGWDHPLILRTLRQLAAGKLLSAIALVHLEASGSSGSRPRNREWREPDGFVQLMQGRNAGTGYPGDRMLMPDEPQLQVHRVAPHGEDELLALALYVPSLAGGVSKVVRRA